MSETSECKKITSCKFMHINIVCKETFSFRIKVIHTLFQLEFDMGLKVIGMHHWINWFLEIAILK